MIKLHVISSLTINRTVLRNLNEIWRMRGSLLKYGHKHTHEYTGMTLQ